MMVLVIIIACTFSGMTLGLTMLLAAMFYTGKWTLPHTALRQIQSAHVRSEVAKFEAASAQARLARLQIEAQEDLLRQEHLDELGRRQDVAFQRQISGGTGG